MSPSFVVLDSEYTLSLTAKDAVWYGGDAMGTAFDRATLSSGEVSKNEKRVRRAKRLMTLSCPSMLTMLCCSSWLWWWLTTWLLVSPLAL